jgi:hypothetical protein
MGDEIFEALEQWMRDPVNIERGLRLDAAVQLAIDHDEQWRKEYPNRWIAVSHTGLIAVEDSRSSLLDRLRELGIPLDEVYKELLREPRPAIILW